MKLSSQIETLENLTVKVEQLANSSSTPNVIVPKERLQIIVNVLRAFTSGEMYNWREK